ncbi:hypothetical protein F5146DRAFT_588348 [Armillaria mellea]|nr:hypothetical protein F5146DRAFT_588348 [Armillaria mellea]
MTFPSPKRIVVIGGGPAGLATLRSLTERGQFDKVELLERRDDVGGVWYLDDPKEGDTKPRWPSPSYPGLVGNVLPEYLSFSKFPFPEPPSTPDQPFPTLVETHDYLRAFAEPYLKNGAIRLNHEVTRVEELSDGAGWKVVFNDWNDEGAQRTEIWDAVVVTVGWYDNPAWPDTEGLSILKEKGLAIHAKWYRGPEPHAGKRALVIGNGNSSNDIASHLARGVAKEPVYRSIRRPALPTFPSLPDPRIVDVAPAIKYSLDASTTKITATLKDGIVIEDIDVVLIGTGYKPIPSFVHVLDPTTKQVTPLMTEEIRPHRIPGLHRYILYAHNPTLAFVLAMLCYTPFTISDLSSTWLSLAWGGEIAYPETAEGRLEFEKTRLASIDKVLEDVTDPSSFIGWGILGTFEQEFCSGLKEDILKVKPELKDILPEWSDERTRQREAMYPLKYKALEYTREQRRKLGQ